MKAPVNNLLVTIDQKYQDKDGHFYIDTSYHPEEYATLKGKVVSVPDRVDDEHWKGNIEQVVRVGDEILFSYAIVYDYLSQKDGETPVYKNLIPYKGEEYWKLDYAEVFFIVRDGKIILPTQNVLLEPIADNSDRVLKSGLVNVTKQATVLEDRARVVALPTTNISCKVGDIIPIEQEFVQKYTFFDKPYYLFSSKRIIAKF